jgi:probable HAF family extracellular repeat protein
MPPAVALGLSRQPKNPTGRGRLRSSRIHDPITKDCDSHPTERFPRMAENVMEGGCMRTRTTTRALVVALIAMAGSYHVSSTAFQDTNPPRYRFMNLRGLGGTNSRGNSINNAGWIAGYSNLAGGQARHATAWFYGQLVDLGTLGGPNSNVAWPVKNDAGLVVGIAQTETVDPSAATWSCRIFFPGPDNARYVCRGFVSEAGMIRALDTLGGLNGYATGANNRREVVGWAENTVVDPSCAPPRTIQFRPVVWGPGPEDIRELPLWPGDSAGAATAINDLGQAVGISGTCDQAVGRHTARNAVLWENGTVVNIGTLGGDTWNTPSAINRRGDIAGFASQAGDDPDAPRLRAFLWTRSDGIRDLGVLDGHETALALGMNDKGQVVGTSCPASGPCHAFIAENGMMRDLNAFRPPGYKHHLTRAQDINNDGAITGSAVDLETNEIRPFLAVPNPGAQQPLPAPGLAVRPPVLQKELVDAPLHPHAPHHPVAAAPRR